MATTRLKYPMGMSGEYIDSQTIPADSVVGTAVTYSSVVKTMNARTITADTTLTADDYIILANSTTAAITITLPVSTTVVGQMYLIKDVAGAANLHNIVITAANLDTIDALSSVTINVPFMSITLYNIGDGRYAII